MQQSQKHGQTSAYLHPMLFIAVILYNKISSDFWSEVITKIMVYQTRLLPVRN